MTVFDIASIREAQVQAKRKVARELNRAQPRYLGGTDVPIARSQYQCCHCIFPIMPGEEYRRDRYVRSYQTPEGEEGCFHYERYHLPQCYGPSEDQDREMREQVEREAEREAERLAA